RSLASSNPSCAGLRAAPARHRYFGIPLNAAWVSELPSQATRRLNGIAARAGALPNGAYIGIAATDGFGYVLIRHHVQHCPNSICLGELRSHRLVSFIP